MQRISESASSSPSVITFYPLACNSYLLAVAATINPTFAGDLHHAEAERERKRKFDRDAGDVAELHGNNSIAHTTLNRPFPIDVVMILNLEIDLK